MWYLLHVTPFQSHALEPIGRRIARLRAECGLTQQTLAARLAVSRVAVSHIEMDLSVPSERTITLLAGIFKQSPQDLVEGTTYPRAKAEKLPTIVCSFTRLEYEIALFENDLAWINRLNTSSLTPEDAQKLIRQWRTRLESFAPEEMETSEREILSQAVRQLDELFSG